MAQPSKETLDFIKEQEDLMALGENIIKEASDEALDYLKDAIENISDAEWRKMTIKTQAVEMGVGVGLAEHLVPNIYNDMTKSAHKKLKVSKSTAQALRHIYIGRVIKNIRSKLNERNESN